MSYAGSNLSAILDALTAEMLSRGGAKVRNEIGAETDAQLARTDRIVWIPREQQPALEPPHEQPVDENGRPTGKAIAQQPLVVDAVIYGKDFEGAIALRNRVVVALESRFGENAASIFDAGSGDLLGGGAAENGAWSTLLPVRFLIPVLSETYLPATIVLTGTQSIQVEDPTGQNAEALS